MHIPLFLNTAEDDDTYFVIPQQERLPMLRRLAAAGIGKVFCGHYHRNAGGVWNTTDDDGKQLTVSFVLLSSDFCGQENTMYYTINYRYKGPLRIPATFIATLALIIVCIGSANYTLKNSLD